MSIKWCLLCNLVFAAILCTSASGQTTWHVDDDTCPIIGVGTPNDPFCSIQVAIDASTNGDMILVANGTYVELIDFHGKAVTLRSVSDNPAATIIDGNNAGTVVTCNSGETADTVLRGVTITRGRADNGAGMNTNVSHPTVISCVFRENIANVFGGGVYSENTIVPPSQSSTFVNCAFIMNAAFQTGGAMENRYGSSPILTNCVFIGNSSLNGGAGMVNLNRCNPILTNCIFSGNETSGHGGGMTNYQLSSPLLRNCTFSGNWGGGSRGAMRNTVHSHPILVNCILWGNGPLGLYNESTSSSIVSSSIVEFGLPAGAINGEGNIDADPLFVDFDGADDIVGTADDDLRLSFGSPAIDAGSNGALSIDTVTDLDGLLRFVDDQNTIDTGLGTAPIVDMGAYEYGLADCNGNDLVSLFEHNRLVSCMTAPEGQLGAGCNCVDLDADGDVDLGDFQLFQRVFAQ